MPIYVIQKDDETQELVCSWDDLQEYLEANPGWKQTLSTPKIVSMHGSVLSKTDDGWKEVLSRVKKGSGKANTIDV